MLRLSLHHRAWVVWLGLMLVLLIPFSAYLDRPGWGMDEGSLLVYPELISKGALPYRDFETFYGPANLYVLAAWYRVFAIDVLSERVLALSYRLAALTALFVLLRRRSPLVAAGSCVLAGLLLVPVELLATAWMGGVACGLAALALGSAGKVRGQAIGSGLLAALALLFRPDLGPAMLLGGAPIFVAMTPRGRWQWLGGFAAGMLPLAALLVAVGAQPLWENLFLYPVIHSNPGRRLPLSVAPPWMLRWVLGYGIAVLGSLAALAVWWWRRRAVPWDRHTLAVSAAVLFGGGLAHQTVQRLDAPHFFGSSFLLLGICPVVIAEMVRRAAPEKFTPLRAAGAFSAPVVALLFANPEWAASLPRAFANGLAVERAETPRARFGERSFPVRQEKNAADISQMLATLHALGRPGQRVFVGPGDLRRTNYADTFLYYLLPQFTPATYFLEMNPLSANRPNSRLADDVASADWLIFNRAMDRWNEPNASAQFQSAAPNEVVANRFEHIADFGDYQLHRKRPSALP